MALTPTSGRNPVVVAQGEIDVSGVQPQTGRDGTGVGSKNTLDSFSIDGWVSEFRSGLGGYTIQMSDESTSGGTKDIYINIEWDNSNSEIVVVAHKGGVFEIDAVSYALYFTPSSGSFSFSGV